MYIFSKYSGQNSVEENQSDFFAEDLLIDSSLNTATARY